MKIHVKTVIDIETGQVLHDEAYEYSGPVALCFGGKKKKKPGDIAKELSDEERALRNRTTGRADAIYADYEGPVIEETPMYKRLYTTGTEDTAAAFDQEETALNQMSHSAGFGYEQPITQAAKAGFGARKAQALGRVPWNARQAVEDRRMDIAGNLEGRAPMYDTSSRDYFDIYATANDRRLQRKQQMYQALARAGTTFMDSRRPEPRVVW